MNNNIQSFHTASFMLHALINLLKSFCLVIFEIKLTKIRIFSLRLPKLAFLLFLDIPTTCKKGIRPEKKHETGRLR